MSGTDERLDRIATLEAENKRLLQEREDAMRPTDADDLNMLVRLNHFGDGMNEHIAGPTTLETATELIRWADSYIFRITWERAMNLATVKAENKRLREALEPFKKGLQYYVDLWTEETDGQEMPDDEDDDGVFYLCNLGIYVQVATIGDFRRAARALDTQP